MTATLQEIEGLLRQHKVSIEPQQTLEHETVELPVVDASGQQIGKQELILDVHNQRKVNGMVQVFDTRTGEAIPVDINRLPIVLSTPHRDNRYPAWMGKLKFTLDKTAAPTPVVGVMKCFMHPEHPDFARYQAMGGEPCRKANLFSLLAVEDHVRVKHRRIWDYMHREEERLERDEEREWRRVQMADLKRRLGMVETVPVEPEPAPAADLLVLG